MNYADMNFLISSFVEKIKENSAVKESYKLKENDLIYNYEQLKVRFDEIDSRREILREDASPEAIKLSYISEHYTKQKEIFLSNKDEGYIAELTTDLEEASRAVREL